jgi:hypothetical protein
MLAQRNNEIATENRILLQKMTKIITSIPAELVEDQTLEKNNKSLNARGRSTELERISKDNQKILNRMMNVTSMHDHKKMQADYAHHDKLLKRLRMVKYVPSDASVSEVSKRGVDEMSKTMSSTFVDTSGRDVDVDSVLSQSQSMATTMVGGTATSKSLGGGNSGGKKKGKGKVPANIATTPKNNGSSAKDGDGEVHVFRRNSTKDELTLLAQAALMDQDMHEEEEDFFDEVKQDKAIDKLMKKNNVTNPRARKLTKRLSALDMTRGEYNLVKQSKGVAILRDGNPVDRDQAWVNVTKKRDGRIRCAGASEASGERSERKRKGFSWRRASGAARPKEEAFLGAERAKQRARVRAQKRSSWLAWAQKGSSWLAPQRPRVRAQKLLGFAQQRPRVRAQTTKLLLVPSARAEQQLLLGFLRLLTLERFSRRRVQVKNDKTPNRPEIDCWADVGVLEARELLGVENKHYFAAGEEGSKASAAKREELLELSWGLIDFAQVQVETREDGRGDRFTVKFMNPILCAQQSIIPGGKLGSFGSKRDFDRVLAQENGSQASLLSAASFSSTVGNYGSGGAGGPIGEEVMMQRPATAEIIAVVEEKRKMHIEVADAPETELVKSVELDITLKNNRRPGVVDIVASVIGGNPNFGKLIEGGVLLTSVGIPTLVSIDLEHTQSYVEGLIGSLKIQLVNMEIRDGESVNVGPKLLVRGGRPATRA